jgi:phage shock protein PspC (stress-responsive transcriptional regulator)
MKKNISINISGIIFHIEEDGYETLKKYLDSINRYFSTFEDSSEILADIESRIAEIFLSKLNEEKQVITSEDVNALVATMGSVSDFKAVEDQEPEQQPAAENRSYESATDSGQQQTSSNTSSSQSYTPPKRLMRDQKRKILGGVCSGLANYFNVDALWIRLIFALLAFAYGITFFAYIIMWILVPGSYDLDEPVVGKKMYRDPERKVIGGVASGVAAYLGIDTIAMRVLFIVFTVMGGLGLFIYIVLWLILPEAKTLTDKMQMQGEPVTLSNIESTLKKNQFEKPAEDESTLTKILLFPFRLIGMILSGLARILRPIMEIIRVGIGVVVVLTGLALVFSIVVTSGILFGIFSTSAMSLPWMAEINETSVPVDAFLRAFPMWTAVAGFFASIVPSIFIVLLGVSVIAKRIVFNAATGWTLFVLFFVSVAVLAVSIPKIVFSFKQEGEYTVENTYKLNGKTARLKLYETGMDDYHAVRLDLEGYDGPDFKLVQTFQAQGSSRAKAIENAKMVEYNVNFKDSVFTFDSNLKFREDAIFRAQRMNMTLYIPYNVPFTMDQGVARFINEYVDPEKRDNETWEMTKAGLKCASCPPEEKNTISDLSDFNEIEINGKFDLRIVSGFEHAVELSGPDKAKEKYHVEQRGRTLIIDFEGKKNFNWKLKDLDLDEVEITVTMPQIEKLEATGMGKIRMDEFNTEDLDIELRGPVKLRAGVTATNLSVNLSGSSEADLTGTAVNLNANVELASKLRAYNLEAQNAFIETSGASSAKVNVTGTLEMEEGVTSDIDYRGNAHVIKRN